jgi:hypothetical protein
MTAKPYKWPAYVLHLAVIQVLLLVCIIAFETLGLGGHPISAALGVGLAALLIGAGMASAVAWLGAFVGYYRDARQLHDTDAGWHPRLWFWALAHVFFAPAAALCYLSKRKRRVGLTYDGTFLDRLPWTST